jgi:hypothetical protein
MKAKDKKKFFAKNFILLAIDKIIRRFIELNIRTYNKDILQTRRIILVILEFL